MRAMLLFAVALSAACAQSMTSRVLDVPWMKADYTPSSGDSRTAELEDLKQRLFSWGVKIEFIDSTQLMGQTIRAEKLIYLSSTLDVNAQLEVLAHEAGHLLQPISLTPDKAGEEVWAEMVSVGVLKFYGHDGRQTSANYLAAYKSGLSILPFYKKDIELTVKILTGQVPARLDW